MKILLVEDHVMFNELLTKACGLAPFSGVVSSAGTAAEARTLLRHGGYSLMILDICLPDANGFEFSTEATRIEPNLKIIGMSAHCDEGTVWRLMQSPLNGFLDKARQTVAELWAAWSKISSGGKYYSPSVEAIRQRLIAAQKGFHKLLSIHEINVLKSVGEGQADDDIGAALNISPLTVKWHRKQIMHKLGLGNRADLVVYAHRKGIAKIHAD